MQTKILASQNRIYSIDNKPEKGCGSGEQQFSQTAGGQILSATGSGVFHLSTFGLWLDAIKVRTQCGAPALNAMLNIPKEVPLTSWGKVVEYRGSLLEVLKGIKPLLGFGPYISGRVPYLSLNYVGHSQATQYLVNHPFKELGGITAATVLSAVPLALAERYKIEAQMGLKKAGRLGLDATLCREFQFNMALHGSPVIAQWMEKSVSPTVSGLKGKEGIMTSMVFGSLVGMFTNPFDQIKTKIQSGTYSTVFSGLSSELKKEGGALFWNRGARFRGVYVGTAITTLNWARTKIEGYMDSVSA